MTLVSRRFGITYTLSPLLGIEKLPSILLPPIVYIYFLLGLVIADRPGEKQWQ